MDRPLLATRDPALADELARLAAAAGAQLEVASSAEDVLQCWTSAPVVLVGADLAVELVELAPPRRSGVQVVAWSPVPSGAFRDALLVGAERVIELPVGAELVAELLTDLGEAGRGEGVPIGVVGGSGVEPAPATLACVARPRRRAPRGSRPSWSTSTRSEPAATGSWPSTRSPECGGTR